MRGVRDWLVFFFNEDSSFSILSSHVATSSIREFNGLAFGTGLGDQLFVQVLFSLRFEPV